MNFSCSFLTSREVCVEIGISTWKQIRPSTFSIFVTRTSSNPGKNMLKFICTHLQSLLVSRQFKYKRFGRCCAFFYALNCLMTPTFIVEPKKRTISGYTPSNSTFSYYAFEIVLLLNIIQSPAKIDARPANNVPTGYVSPV